MSYDAETLARDGCSPVAPARPANRIAPNAFGMRDYRLLVMTRRLLPDTEHLLAARHYLSSGIHQVHGEAMLCLAVLGHNAANRLQVACLHAEGRAEGVPTWTPEADVGGL